MPRASNLQRSAVCYRRAVDHHVCNAAPSAILTEVVVALQSALGSSLSEEVEHLVVDDRNLWFLSGASKVDKISMGPGFPFAFDIVKCYRNKGCWRYISGQVRHAFGINMM